MSKSTDFADLNKSGAMPDDILGCALPEAAVGDLADDIEAFRDELDAEEDAAIAAEQGERQRAEDGAFHRGDEAELGADLAARLGPAGDVVCAESRVWRCDGTTWDMLADEALTLRALRYAGQLVRVIKPDALDTFRSIRLSSNSAKGVVQIAKVHLHQPAFFAEAPEGAAFANCFARIDGNRVVVEPLARDHRVKREHAAPFDLQMNAGRPAAVDRLLAQAWDGCPDFDDRVRYFWEWLGAAICGIATRYKDTPLLVGPKDTGKSQVLKAITACFPAGSRRSVTLHAMASDYHRAHLSGGRINFVNELPAREVLDGEAPKAILSGDPVVCRRPTEMPFDWTPRCAHVFAANELPPSRDAALLDRFVLLECPNVVARENQDRTLAAKIEAEAPQIVAAALNALGALLTRGYLVRPASADAAAGNWRLNGDAVATWADECLKVSDKSTSAMDLYNHFEGWRERHGHARMNTTNFGRRLGALGFCRLHSNGKRWRAVIVSDAQQAANTEWAGQRYGSE